MSARSVAAAILTVAAAGCASAATEATVRPGAPAEVAVTPAPNARAGGSTYVEVTVSGYTPAADGAVQIVVDTAEGGREVGRFGLFPELAFTANQPERVQRFAFPLATGAAPLQSVRVRLVPSGTGRGAAAEVSARIVRRD